MTPSTAVKKLKTYLVMFYTSGTLIDSVAIQHMGSKKAAIQQAMEECRYDTWDTIIIGELV